MIILGIDPGSRRIGYGLIRKTGGRIELLSAGILRVKSKDKPQSLLEIKSDLDRLIKKFHPELLAIEKIYFMKNQKTGIEVAESRGIMLLAAAEHGLKIKEYAPNEIKANITGYGLSDKKAVLKMIGLALNKGGLKIIDDASDALAAALTAVQKTAIDNNVS